MRHLYSSNKLDYHFITTLLLVVIFGLIMLASASIIDSFQRFNDNYYYLKHQIIYGLLPGLVFFFIALKINYRILRKFSFIILIFSVILLMLVFLPQIGTTQGTGAKSWLDFWGFSVQPSEIVKLTFLIYLAAWFEARGADIKSWYYGLAPFLFTLGIIAGLVILQPDIGTVSIILIMSLAVFFIAGARFVHLFFLTGLSLAGIILLIHLAPYRAKRLTVFLHSELDPQGIGYHINQALLAVGSGGIFGLGLGQSRQKFQYLPQAAGDSIFAIIAEELGFIFTLVFLAIFAYLIYRGLKIAKNAPDNFSKYLISGIMIWWFSQAVINICGMLSLLPMTGVPLPFISYGGTALMTSLAAAGIVVNISKNS